MPALGNGWNPLRLKGLAYPKLWYRFDYPDEYDREVLVWYVRISPRRRGGVLQYDPARRDLRYGMTRCDCGQTWRHKGHDKVKLRTLAEGELRKDLFVLEQDGFPEALARVVFIGPGSRSHTDVELSQKRIAAS